MVTIEDILSIQDPVKKRAYFIALISSEIKKLGGNPPIVVGGEALEIYTQGSYTTGDIDIKAPKELISRVLQNFNFKNVGRLWINEELDIYIDWLGDSLDEGKEAEDRVVEIELSEGLYLRVISIEDLIIDRLNAYKRWSDQDSKMWVEILFEIADSINHSIDWQYLKRRSSEENIEEIFDELKRRYDQKG